MRGPGCASTAQGIHRGKRRRVFAAERQAADARLAGAGAFHAGAGSDHRARRGLRARHQADLRYAACSTLLSTAGFGWFTIDYRLTPEFQLPHSTEDVANAIRWVRENAARYHVDPEKIVLAGESAGGFLVAYAGVKAKGDTRLRAVVDFYGPNDLMLQTEKRRAEDPTEGPGMKEWLGFKSWKQPGVEKNCARNRPRPTYIRECRRFFLSRARPIRRCHTSNRRACAR